MTQNAESPIYLTASGWARYLKERFPALGDVQVTRLSGGVSSRVFLCESGDGNSGGARWVVKQALEYLDVEESWPAARERILTETHAMNALRPLLPEGGVPKIQFVDEALFAYGMEAVPTETVLLKTALLSGRWPMEWIMKCAELLAALHRESAAREAELRAPFQSRVHFQSLRIDPYYRHAARSNTELAAHFERAAENALAAPRCLVHGDFSPKNIFVHPKWGDLTLLDYEVMHWGNPAFDVAFFLTHLLAKGIHHPRLAVRYAQSILDFMRIYAADSGPAGAVEEDILLQWGAISLARVDGKSPLEYLTESDEKKRLREFGRDMLTGKLRSVDSVAYRLNLEE